MVDVERWKNLNMAVSNDKSALERSMDSHQGALRALIFLAGFLAAFQPSMAAAQSVDEFYRGKRIRLVVGSAGGGGYDAFARTMVRYLGRHIPGNPSFVVDNMPGGGGLLSANYLYNVAPRDGLVIGMVERGSAMEPIVNAKLGRARFDSRQFNWIGSPTQEVGLVMVRQPSPIQEIDDLKNVPLIVSSTTHTAPTSVYPRILNNLFGTRFKVIEGYKSSRDALLALERGEVEGHVSGASSGILRAQIAPWIAERKIKIMMQLGLTKDVAYPDTILVTELATSSEDHEILALMFAQQVLPFPLMAPPDVPADRVDALRHAFDATMRDAGFLEDAQRQNLKIDPVSGVQIHALLDRLYATPAAVIERFSDLSGDK
jgi:tripartite-type tricarboxylate transporter receptor subunit TctC